MDLTSLLSSFCIMLCPAIAGTLPPGGNPVKPRVVGTETYYGKVIATSKTSITIVEDGKKEVVYKVSDSLAAGEVGENDHLRRFYQLKTVCIGDVVDIKMHRYADKSVICVGIVIRRRPGGRVPPSPNERASSRIRHSEIMNAYQDLEERGIPLPAKFDADAKLRALDAKRAAEDRLKQEREQKK